MKIAAFFSVAICLSFVNVRANAWRAFSLRAFIKEHKACAGKTCSEELLHCGGITRLRGYVVDKAGNDIVLIGEAVKALPPLHIEDFIVALRNAFYKYADKKGGNILYSAPTCSIDPDPKMLKRLHGIGMEIMGKRLTDEEFAEEMKQWKKVCSAPQSVRILGVPHNTRFAGVMVEADYELKKLVDGSKTLDVEGFESHTDLILAQSRKEFMAGKRATAAPSMMNRFWFSPGKYQAVENAGTVFITSFPVQVLTEQEMLAATGRRAQKGKIDPLAKEFAQLFSKNYHQIGRKMPVYLELEALYRFVLVSRAIHEREELKKANFSAQYLFGKFPVSKVSVSGTVPGWSHYEQMVCKREEAEGIRVAQFRIPSCGGVSMDIKIGEKGLKPAKTRKIDKLHKAVVQSKPDKSSLSWDFKPSKGK